MKAIKFFTVVLFSFIFLTSCIHEPISSEKMGKDDKFEVEFLFEKDGIRMYRFYDASKFHYFTTTGETVTSQSTGKTDYDENIKTNLDKREKINW